MGDDNAVQNITTNIYGDVCLRKARRKRRKLLITELFFDYTRNTTLHGIPYVTKRGLTMAEKIFWLITFIISVSWCSFLIYQLWFRWKTSPVLVTINEEVVSVGKVPFPSVTICPQLKIKSSVYNYTDEFSIILQISKELDKSQDVMNTKYSLLRHVIKRNDLYQVCHDIFIPIKRNITNFSMVEHIHQVAPDHDDVFYWCSLLGTDDEACKRTFKKVLTRDGVCFTANSLAYDEIFRIENLQKKYKYLYETRPSKGWGIEEGYNLSEPDPYPRRGTDNEHTPDLLVAMKENVTERDSMCNVINSGYKVYIHHPADLPQSSLYYYAVVNNRVSSVALSFNILNTSESLRSYAPEIRQCYFPEERYLKYFRHYTENNCLIECISNYTFEKCGCVDFYMPHSSDKICAEGSDHCKRDAQAQLKREEATSLNGCHCLPACMAVDYDADILHTDLNTKKWIETGVKFNGDSYASQYKGIKFSKIEMFYKKPRFLSMRRSELFGITEFIANCGGLLGLFMGFSFLTLVEFFYFLTLRLWCTLKKDFKEEKTRAEMEEEDTNKKF